MQQEPIVGLTQSEQVASLLVMAKDFFQILFFVLTGSIAIRTYQKATKTLFQPMRTEIFKEQLKVLSEISDVLSADITDSLQLYTMVDINSSKFWQDYGQLAFNIKVSHLVMPYKPKTFGYIANFYRDGGENSQLETYKFQNMHVPISYVELYNKLDIWTGSPIIPREIRSNLLDLHQALIYYIRNIKVAIDEVKIDLQRDNMSKEEYLALDATSVISRVNQKLPSMSRYDITHSASQVVLTIRNYYDPDGLFGANSGREQMMFKAKKPNLIKPRATRYRFDTVDASYTTHELE